MQTSDIVNVLCVLLGFGLAAIADEFKYRLRERARAKLIRNLIVDEMHYNKNLLRSILQRVTEQRKRYRDSLVYDEKSHKRRSSSNEAPSSEVMVKFAPSNLSSDVWSAHLKNISDAFSREEAIRCIRFYRKLEEIKVEFAEFATPRPHHSFIGRDMRPLEEAMEAAIAIPIPES